MHQGFTIAALLCAFLMAPVAQAQPAPVVTPQGWTGGFGVLIGDSEFAGEGARVIPIPVITYESERWFVQGPLAGIHLHQANGFSLDATIGVRFNGWDANDLGRAELAERGVDRDLLDDRDYSADLGLAASWLGGLGRVQLALKSDVLGASDGQELSVEYTAAVPFAGGRFLPGINVSYWSDKLANYYYGTQADEVARGAPDYRPDAFVMPSLRLGYQRQLGTNWQFYGLVDYRLLPSAVSDSPLVERGRDGAVGVILALTRQF